MVSANRKCIKAMKRDAGEQSQILRTANIAVDTLHVSFNSSLKYTSKGINLSLLIWQEIHIKIN